MATCRNFHMELEDSEVCCPLCFDIFQVPKSFPNCAHNICKSCLSSMIAMKNDLMEIECPVCRQTSPIPTQGVDGFPTNTLIVRLVEKIPGMKDKSEINRAVARCTDEIERKKKMHENMEKQLAVVNKNKRLGEELKKQISSQAKESVAAIVKCEERMHKEVDDLLNKHCGLTFHKELETEMERLTNYLQVAQNCVFNVEDTVNTDDLAEISMMKEVIEAQLNEYSNYPELSILESAMNVKAFDMTFEKSEIPKDVLGKLISDSVIHPQRLSLKRSSKAHVHEAQHDESAGSGLEMMNSLSMNDGSSLDDERPVSIDDFPDVHVVEVEREREVLHHVNLAFCPSRIAVCPQSGDVALLWKENRKVFLYSASAEYKATIHIMYGTLSDVGFCSLGDVVVVNRESNRLLFYSKDGTFLRRKIQIPNGNLKYTYLSYYNDLLTVVSSKMTDDCEIDDSIIKCVVVYKSDSATLYKVFGKGQLVNPLSRAVYHQGNIYVADTKECHSGYNIVVKAFTGPTFQLAQMVLDIPNAITAHLPTDFVSIFRNYFNSFGPLFLLIGYPGLDYVCAIDESHDWVENRHSRPVKQQEAFNDNTESQGVYLADNDIIQVEIESLLKSFEIVVYSYN